MQKITYYCDKCGKQIKEGRCRLEIINAGRDATVGSYDLHPKCKDEIVALLSAPEEEGPKKKIDHGKIMALHDAGWKNKDIAAEMHLETSQVSQVIYQEGRKKR
ncbi:MAG: hypothetical protein LUD72_11300 [Bacteroidales bacterium]|nr:hypothetical protein [Bacteroidales bacterium]